MEFRSRQRPSCSGDGPSGSCASMAGDTRQASRENNVLRSVCALFALCLVVYHCCIPESAKGLVQGVGRFAVPVFFMLSGYFCYSRDGHAERNLSRKTLRILKLAILAKLLYTLLDLAYMLGGVITWDVFVHNTLLWSTDNMHLWFVNALLLMYVFWWLLHRLDVRRESVYFLIPAVLAADIVFAEILPMAGIGTEKIGEIIYPFIALPFFMIGNALHRYKDRVDALDWLTMPVLVTLMFGGAVLSLIETLAVPGANLYVGSLILAVSLFVFSFRVPEDRLRCHWLECIGRDLAGLIYILHPAVISLMVLALGPWMTESWAFPLNVVLALVACVLVSLLTRKVSEHSSAKAASRRAVAE